MLKDGIKIKKRGSLSFIMMGNDKIMRFKPWLGDSFSFMYDYIMEKSVFPRKFDADMDQHIKILKHELKHIHKQRVLELATGSGNASQFLPNDNIYIGTDISTGLLRKAVKSFRDAGFAQADFFVISVDDLPFNDDYFDVVICNLALNFFDDSERIFHEIQRVLSPGGCFICTVPVPERNKKGAVIRGNLYSMDNLEHIANKQGLTFELLPYENGVILYFKSRVPEKP